MIKEWSDDVSDIGVFSDKIRFQRNMFLTKYVPDLIFSNEINSGKIQFRQNTFQTKYFSDKILSEKYIPSKYCRPFKNKKNRKRIQIIV